MVAETICAAANHLDFTKTHDLFERLVLHLTLISVSKSVENSEVLSPLTNYEAHQYVTCMLLLSLS